MSKHKFETEVNQLLQLIIHSLYSHKEIFLRELISNASDALDKLKLLTLTDDALKGYQFEPRIDITFDETAKTLTISDTGIGMSADELIDQIGTIARSGTKSFMQKLSGDEKKDANLIGQFGVGFYSAFMVADTIEITSRKAGTDTGAPNGSVTENQTMRYRMQNATGTAQPWCCISMKTDRNMPTAGA